MSAYPTLTAAALIVASLAAAGTADAGQFRTAHFTAPFADSQFDQIKKPGNHLTFGLMNPGVKVGFNPQPDPPGDAARFLNPGSLVGFNPQPDPPAVR